jgi:hypothetical protein
VTLIADHSTGRSSTGRSIIIGGTLRRLGYEGVVRYACAGRANVSITPGEIADLKANGIPVAIVCEHEADWLLRANVAGRVSGSRDITRACHLDDGVTWCAADWDATLGGPTSPGSPGDKNMHGVHAGLKQAASVIGPSNVGFYGGYYAIDWLVRNAPWIQWHWQAEAWSHGNRHPKARIFQRAQSANVAGVQIDLNERLSASWGQRVHVTPPKPPPPPPKPVAQDLWWRAEIGMCIEGPHKNDLRIIRLPATHK